MYDVVCGVNRRRGGPRGNRFRREKWASATCALRLITAEKKSCRGTRTDGLEGILVKSNPAGQSSDASLPRKRSYTPLPTENKLSLRVTYLFIYVFVYDWRATDGADKLYGR